MAKKRQPLAAKGRTYAIDRIRSEPDYRMPADFNYTASGGPCADGFNKLAKGQCLVQLTFDQGMPALRFCATKKQPGRLVHVDSPSEAAEAARIACECFEQTGSYEQCLPEGLKLGGARKTKPRRAASTKVGKYCVQRGGRTLSCHTTKAAADKAAKAARDRCKRARGAAQCRGKTTVKKRR